MTREEKESADSHEEKNPPDRFDAGQIYQEESSDHENESRTTDSSQRNRFGPRSSRYQKRGTEHGEAGSDERRPHITEKSCIYEQNCDVRHNSEQRCDR